MSDGADEGLDQAIVEKAKSLGWAERENWRGDPALWKDAQTFVEASEHILPIVQATNKRLERQLNEMSNQLAEAMQAIGVSAERLKKFEESRAADVARGIEEGMNALKAERRRAVADGDSDRTVEIDEKLDSLRDSLAQAKSASAPAPNAPPPQLTPAQIEMQRALGEWEAANPWYKTDPEKKAYADAMSTYIRTTKHLVGLPLLKELDKVIAEKYGTGPAVDRFDSGNNGSGAGGGGGPRPGAKPSYANLSKEAKEACDRFEKTLVGPNKKYKTQAEWRQHYAEQVSAQS